MPKKGFVYMYVKLNFTSKLFQPQYVDSNVDFQTPISYDHELLGLREKG